MSFEYTLTETNPWYDPGSNHCWGMRCWYVRGMECHCCDFNQHLCLCAQLSSKHVDTRRGKESTQLRECRTSKCGIVLWFVLHGSDGIVQGSLLLTKFISVLS